MKENNVSLEKVIMQRHKKDLEDAIKLANIKYGYDLSEEKKNKIALYSVPTTMVLTSTIMAGIAYFNPSIVTEVLTTVSYGTTIISAMAVRKPIKNTELKIKDLKNKYNEYINQYVDEQETLDLLKGCENMEVKTLTLKP